MSQQSLKMKYHPARKEVIFTRIQKDGREIQIPPSSRLGKYMGMKGKFVLQDFGKNFFDDIADAFDGLKSLNISVVTTRLDYEDFTQMVEQYNLEGRCKITSTLVAELPNMDKTFEQVKAHGEESINILSVRSREFYDIDLRTPSVREVANTFAQQLNHEIEEIRGKIENLNDTNISLCFTGVYSSGKSALINAILGYRILPEKINSETAKMFVIRSPRSGSPVKLSFTLPEGPCELEWDDKSKTFDFVKGPNENATRASIQNMVNDIKGKTQYEQIGILLKYLNDAQQVSSEIGVYFPIPLDSKLTQFTIYDTPGADSNYAEHQIVLERALSTQQQSILVFVAKPNGLEGEGNSALLNYLKNAEQKNIRTSIDIGRSLFVINWADCVPAEQRMTLQTEKITCKDDDSFSIKLEDKKLFFTSALYAYAAKAVKNGVAQQAEQFYLESGLGMLSKDGHPMANCYRQNRCATSESATQRMIALSDAALRKAREDDSPADQVIVSSGLFALENEICVFGEKFASAIRAFAIIDSVDKALTKLDDSATSLRANNQKNITDIEQEIQALRKTITQAVNEKYEEMSLASRKEIPPEMQKKLMLDKDSIDKTVGQTRASLDKKIKGWFFGYGKVGFKESDRKTAVRVVQAALNDFKKNFLKQRNELLNDQGQGFMDAIKDAIRKNGEISETTKKEFLHIPAVKVNPMDSASDIGKIYDDCKTEDHFLWMKKDYLKKQDFLNSAENKMLDIMEIAKKDYEKDFIKSLESVLELVKQRFNDNLENYSKKMKALIDDRDEMVRLGEKVSATADELRRSQDKLNRIIWEESQDA